MTCLRHRDRPRARAYRLLLVPRRDTKRSSFLDPRALIRVDLVERPLRSVLAPRDATLSDAAFLPTAFFEMLTKDIARNEWTAFFETLVECLAETPELREREPGPSGRAKDKEHVRAKVSKKVTAMRLRRVPTVITSIPILIFSLRP